MTPWRLVVSELCPGLTDPEVALVVDMAHVTLVHAADTVTGRQAWRDELANLAVAYATANR